MLERQGEGLDAFLQALLLATNEILAASIVVIAVSLLLYNLTRNLRNRVARTSSYVLGCVTISYVFDVFLSLGPGPAITETALRLQWIGIAFIPAAMFHLSDALLATTGLPSRGRRRRIVRIFYAISAAFFAAAALTGILITPTQTDVGLHLQSGPMFYLFLIYYISTNIVAFLFVNRARQRCLTRSTQRRMTYLQSAILTPAIGIFPYSVWLMPGDVFSVDVLTLVNVANIIIMAMLLFLSYPLSFFGSDIPDRVVKVELLRFLLRGPATGLLILAVIVFTTRGAQFFGLPGDDFMPFAVVAVVLLWQWSIALAMPWIEQQLVYRNEDDEQISHLQDLSDRLLTRNDLLQLIEATLEATCDYLQTQVAFVAMVRAGTLETIQQVGTLRFDADTLAQQSNDLITLVSHDNPHVHAFHTWGDYQVAALYSKRASSDNNLPQLIGIMGVEATTEHVQQPDEDRPNLLRFVRRAEQTLDDILLQSEIVAALEGLLPQVSTTRQRAEELEYRPGRQPLPIEPVRLPNRDEAYEQVRAALRHYWGGSGITHSRLLDLRVVQQALANGQDTPVSGLRAILQVAVEKLRPDGERTMTSPEWTLYNIVDLRFIEGKKVRDVARRLSVSEADLYRKQRVAIQAVTDELLEMEREALANAAQPARQAREQDQAGVVNPTV